MMTRFHGVPPSIHTSESILLMAKRVRNALCPPAAGLDKEGFSCIEFVEQLGHDFKRANEAKNTSWSAT